MASTVLVMIFLGVSWLLVILGGVGVGGLGTDSRDFGLRERSEERGWRSLLSR
jgi:hypothetical protein